MAASGANGKEHITVGGLLIPGLRGDPQGLTDSYGSADTPVAHRSGNRGFSAGHTGNDALWGNGRNGRILRTEGQAGRIQLCTSEFAVRMIHDILRENLQREALSRFQRNLTDLQAQLQIGLQDLRCSTSLLFSAGGRAFCGGIDAEGLCPVSGAVLIKAADTHRRVAVIQNVAAVSRRVHPPLHDLCGAGEADSNVLAAGDPRQDGEAVAAVWPRMAVRQAALCSTLHSGFHQVAAHGQRWELIGRPLPVDLFQNGISLIIIERAGHRHIVHRNRFNAVHIAAQDAFKGYLVDRAGGIVADTSAAVHHKGDRQGDAAGGIPCRAQQAPDLSRGVRTKDDVFAAVSVGLCKRLHLRGGGALQIHRKDGKTAVRRPVRLRQRRDRALGIRAGIPEEHQNRGLPRGSLMGHGGIAEPREAVGGTGRIGILPYRIRLHRLHRHDEQNCRQQKYAKQLRLFFHDDSFFFVVVSDCCSHCTESGKPCQPPPPQSPSEKVHSENQPDPSTVRKQPAMQSCPERRSGRYLHFLRYFSGKCERNIYIFRDMCYCYKDSV